MSQNLKVIRLQGEFTRPDDGTAYAANDAVSNSTSAPTLLELRSVKPDGSSNKGLVAGGSYQVKSVKLTASSGTTTNASFDVYLFTSGITAINDNAAFTLLYADKHKRIGKSACTLVTAGTGSDSAEIVNSAVDYTFNAIGDSVYCQVVATAAYVPTRLEKFFVQIEVIRIDD